MTKRNQENYISGLAALLVFCVFAGGILSVLLSGASAYRRLTERDQMAYDSRTCLQYVATKIRQVSTPDCVLLSEFGDGDALVIVQDYDGSEYWTRVYCYDGWLMELFTSAAGDFTPEDGEKIMEAESLTLMRTGDLLRVIIVDGNGMQVEQTMFLRGGRGAVS